MKLTDGEKLIAFMLADIMEGGGIKGDIDPAFVKTAIAGDDLWALNWKFNGLFHSGGPDDAVVEETGKIMTMCRIVENSIAHLSPESRATIPEHQHKVFVGFDGNEEPHFGVATMLVQHLDRFEEWEDRDLNSHHNTLDRYRRMRATLDEQVKNHNGLLNLAGIEAVFAA